MPTLSRLALASTLLAFATPAFASFSDVPPKHSNAIAIEYLQGLGAINGYPDGTFKPANTINRAEFVKILIGARYEKLHIDTCLEDVEASYRIFPDVPVAIWYEDYLCLAKNLGIVSGYPDGTFGGEKSISFAEAAKIITLVFKLPVTEGNVWYEGYVHELAAKKAIPMTITRFDQQITRGEMAEIIWRLDTNTTDLTSQTYESFKNSGQSSSSATNSTTLQFRVSGSAMADTLNDGDYVTVQKSAAFDRGDIIIFKPSFDPQKPYIKRVIGLPGETIIIENGVVEIQKGSTITVLNEPYLNLKNQGKTYRHPPGAGDTSKVTFVVPVNSYFVMGDNRQGSLDSRSFGEQDDASPFIMRSEIIGKVVTNNATSSDSF